MADVERILVASPQTVGNQKTKAVKKIQKLKSRMSQDRRNRDLSAIQGATFVYSRHLCSVAENWF